MIIKRKNQKSGEVKKSEKQTQKHVAPVETAENFTPEIQDLVTETVPPQPTETQAPEPDIDLFDIENIDFTQRQERRRGSRRRGYRRIDDRNLVSRAQEESENIKKSAFEEGYRIGLEKANADIEAFKQELSNFMNARKDVFEYIAPDILEICVDISKKIIKKELDSDPQILIDTIIDILKTVSKNEPKIVIRVQPHSVQFVKDTIPNITYQYGIDSKINIVADPSIEEGGCVFQTSNGIVDASIDTQLEIIKKALIGI
ncbi:hypothetical protein IJ384_02140 [bacterium]|nr:hypothetical protein [bacterium]